ncbi:MAG: NADH-quinone oxidoreductase subunit N [Planctomycetaceae bacterium]|nr:NADH-quinone oxidoreductase subunit N [Planctomycetaceae bacterium]
MTPELNAGTLLNELFVDTVGISVPLFRPELCFVATIVLLLLCRMLPLLRYVDSGGIALGGVCFAAWFAYVDFIGIESQVGESMLSTSAIRQELFGGLLVFDSFTAFLRLVLAGFLILYIAMTKLSGIPDREDGADFYSLVLGSSLGMCLMVSANNLLMVFMAVEMASVPSYVLAGMLKGRPASSEAALKYAVYGAGTAGVMLYGISLISGVLGTLVLPDISYEISRVLAAGGTSGSTMVLCLGGLMLSVGLAFKLSAVPFHFWCPDVFEGAAAEVGAFLSVASKAAAIALLVRVAFAFSMPASGAAVGISGNVAALADSRHFVVYVIGLLAAVTCTFGNLAAYGQTNMKRLLAYSTIAHAGYLMMAVAAAVAMLAISPEGARDAVTAVAFYLATYLFMNLGAFGIVAFLRNRLKSEEISAYAGLIRVNPGVVVAMAVVLVSLIGLPPLAGFVAKFLVFSSLVDAITTGAESPLMLSLLAIGGLNTVISLFYYLRVLKVMTFDPVPEDRVSEPFSFVSISGAMITGLVIPVVVFGVFWSGLYVAAHLAGAIAS